MDESGNDLFYGSEVGHSEKQGIETHILKDNIEENENFETAFDHPVFSNLRNIHSGRKSKRRKERKYDERSKSKKKNKK